MKPKQVCGMGAVGVILAVIAFLTQPALGTETQELRRVREQLDYSTSAADLLVQQPDTAIIQITDIKVNSTNTGIEVILQTPTGEGLKPVVKSEGNSFIADIPNAVLVLPEGKNEFRTDNPTNGIMSVVVSQVNAKTVDGEFLDPSRGTQYEVGIKADLFDGRLFATLAAYDISKTNIAVTDFNNPDFYVALGEVKSRGIEFDIAGEISPGWNVIASAYLNDAFVSEDNDQAAIGKNPLGTPKHGASLWTTYEIQEGSLKGLMFGGGIFFVGDRVPFYTDFTVPSYVRTDAVISYKRDNWQAALNFKNIFNIKHYQTTDPFLYPQTPFAVQGTFSVQF